ncbi:HPP family protein [Natrononativus amylolyticus]|uniref:HPP family protein n=1 Tax=Natrononativus amylolyticus TaxID=2963434 RepID=UPI0020CFCFC9|nr:HPP family protein [Natrononativus amylolyticus]
MVRYRVGTSLYASVLFTILGGIAVVTGQPFIFPSLGPTAFILAFDRRGARTNSYRIVGSHIIGVTAGLIAYGLIANGVSLTAAPLAYSPESVRLAFSGVVSIALTSWGVIAVDANHPPACATTLIVSLGLLSTPLAAATIVGAVIILVESHQLFILGWESLVDYLE